MKKKSKKHPFKYFLVFFLMIVFLYLISGYVFGIARVQSLSMEPALYAGDFLLFNRINKTYLAGDIVLIEQDKEKSILVKRVIAVAGDKVDIDNSTGILSINGKEEELTQTKGKTTTVEDGLVFPAVVSKDCVFVLGDNRENTADSRQIGMVSITKIIGKVFYIVKSNHKD